jgi:hypothetical protein
MRLDNATTRPRAATRQRAPNPAKAPHPTRRRKTNPTSPSASLRRCVTSPPTAHPRASANRTPRAGPPLHFIKLRCDQTRPNATLFGKHKIPLPHLNPRSPQRAQRVERAQNEANQCPKKSRNVPISTMQSRRRHPHHRAPAQNEPTCAATATAPPATSSQTATIPPQCSPAAHTPAAPSPWSYPHK